MLHFLSGDELARHPDLALAMFRDRAAQFCARLGWRLDIGKDGGERDAYDRLNPLYVIWEEAGRHGGSARFLPTTGQTMVRDHFSHLTDGAAIESPFIWECTRLCLAPGAGSRVAAALLLGGAELMRAFSLEHFLGVFDAPMLRVYAALGASPQVLSLKDGLGLGLWSHCGAARVRLLRRARLCEADLALWSTRAFGVAQAAPAPGTQYRAAAVQPAL